MSNSDFEFWNFTYRMPKGSKEVPRVRLEFEVVYAAADVAGHKGAHDGWVAVGGIQVIAVDTANAVAIANGGVEETFDHVILHVLGKKMRKLF